MPAGFWVFVGAIALFCFGEMIYLALTAKEGKNEESEFPTQKGWKE